MRTWCRQPQTVRHIRPLPRARPSDSRLHIAWNAMPAPTPESVRAITVEDVRAFLSARLAEICGNASLRASLQARASRRAQLYTAARAACRMRDIYALAVGSRDERQTLEETTA